MIKKIIFLILVFSSIFAFTNTYASDTGSGVTVEVTENIPGANCVKNTDNGKDTKLYTCTVQKGFGTVISMLGEIIKYFTYIAGLGSVLYLIINGIIYSMSGLGETKGDAKKRITDNLLGIVLLLLSGPILYIVAPWIYTT